MKATVFGIRNCDTMKKAMAWLDAQGIEYDFHDYRRDGVPAERLAAWAQRLGWESLANKRGTTWRRIPQADREGLDEAGALRLLAAHPGAIRRPVLACGSRILVGFDPAQYARVFSR